MASSKDNDLVLNIRALDGFSKPAREITAAIERLNRAMSSIKSGSLAQLARAGAGSGRQGSGPAMPIAPAGQSGSRRGAGGGVPSMAAAMPVMAMANPRAGGAAALAAATEPATRMARASVSSAQRTAPLGAGLGFGLFKGAQSVYDMEKSLNVSVAAGNLSLAQRDEFLAQAIGLNSEFAATASGIVDAGNRLLRAGLSFEQMSGALPGVLSTAQAMDVPMEAASKAIVDSMTSMRMAMDSVSATMASSTRIADLLAHAVNSTTGELDDFTTSAKYFNPVAAAMGLSPEEATAYQVALAKNGIRGSSAGTGLRSAPVSIADPSKKARQAFARLGIDPSAFLGDRTSAASGDSIAAALEAAGFTADGIEDAIDAVLRDAAMRAAPARAATEIMGAIGDQLGVVTGEDRSLISDVLQRAITAGVREVDLIGALRALNDRGAGIADFTAIFGRNHASKMMALDPAIFDEVYASILQNAAGTSKRMRSEMMAGIVGDVAELDAAAEKISQAIGKSGITDDASRGIAAMSDAINRLADSNPALLKFGTYALLATASLAPLGFALGGIGAAAAFLANPLTLAAGAIAGLVVLNLEPISNGIRTFANAVRRSIDPAIVDRFREVADGVRETFGSLRRHSLSFNRLGNQVGTSFAEGLNRLASAAPRLREVGASFAPLVAAVRSFAVDKILALRDAGATIADFASRAGPALSPALASAISLMGGSLDVLGRGAGAVVRVIGGVTEGLTAFGRGVLEGIDTGALASAGRAIASVMDGLAAPLERFRSLFDSVDFDVASLAGRAGQALGIGISWVVEDLARGHSALSAAWEGLKSTLVAIGSFVPDFSTIIASIRSFVGFVRESAESLAAGAEAMRDAASRFGFGSGGAAGGTRSAKPSAWTGDGVPVGGGDGTRPPSAALAGNGVPVGGTGNLPRRRSGGAVRRGSYLVGEAGPEVVHMGGNGYVTPNHKLSGGGDIHIGTINLTATNPKSAADEFVQQLGLRLSRSRSISMSGRPMY